MSRQAKRTEVQKLQSKVRKLQTDLRKERHYSQAIEDSLKPAQDAWRDAVGPAAVAETTSMLTVIEWMLGYLPGRDPAALEALAGDDPSDFAAKNEEGAKEFAHGLTESDFDSATAELNSDEEEPVHNDSN